jgi:AraC-like DNA-binding protein
MAAAVSQAQAISAAPLGAGEKARFFRVPRQLGLECLAASFRTHVYAPHSHDTFAIGVIEAGCEVYAVRGAVHHAGPGDVVFVNPGEVHDGAPFAAGYTYRMSYPEIELLRAIAADLSERPLSGTPYFPASRAHDPGLAARFAAAHRALEGRAGALEADERLHAAYAAILARHAAVAPAATEAVREAGPVTRALAFLDAHFDEDVDLARLAEVAGIPRTRLIRAVKRQTGLTPHAWLTDRRVRTARRLLAAGESPAAVAAACGFFDQSHLNRAFKARLGVTPGAFRAG